MIERRRFTWRDERRNRPVLADVWMPGDAPPCPLVLLSHGANGAALNYSWLAAHLAGNGIGVLGVSHYGESWAYGLETIDPAAVTLLWERPTDCSFALTQLLAAAECQGRIDASRIGAVGHSSGGATVLALGGATLDPAALLAYCRSDAALADRGCDYTRQVATSSIAPPATARSQRDPRIRAIVALDPAAGPGHDAASLAQVRVPALIVASVENDFLPFEHHAGRYADLLPNATLVELSGGEGHFVYLDTCASSLTANGVPLCVDRPGVDRDAVHARLAPEILAFLMSAL